MRYIMRKQNKKKLYLPKKANLFCFFFCFILFGFFSPQINIIQSQSFIDNQKEVNIFVEIQLEQDQKFYANIDFIIPIRFINCNSTRYINTLNNKIINDGIIPENFSELQYNQELNLKKTGYYTLRIEIYNVSNFDNSVFDSLIYWIECDFKITKSFSEFISDNLILLSILSISGVGFSTIFLFIRKRKIKNLPPEIFHFGQYFEYQVLLDKNRYLKKKQIKNMMKNIQSLSESIDYDVNLIEDEILIKSIKNMRF